MAKIINYLVVRDTSLCAMEDRVNACIADGLYLYEAPFTVTEYTADVFYCQAMVKYEDENADIRINK